MTIDEAIEREREMAEMYRNDIVPKENYHNMPWIDENNEASNRSAEEHEQLAEWLKELKELRATSCGYSKEDIELNRNAMYNKAIDDAVQVIEDSKSLYDNSRHSSMGEKDRLQNLIKKLKVGGENE